MGTTSDLGGGVSAAPRSALPPRAARIIALISVLLGGLCGALVGLGVARFECDGACGSWHGVGTLIGALMGAGGVAVVVVLALRAMGEWKTIQQREAHLVAEP